MFLVYINGLACVLSLKVSAKQLSTSRERDFFRWVKLPIPIYNAKVPVRVDASCSAALDGRGSTEISLVLPSDHLQALHAQGEKALRIFSKSSFKSWKSFWETIGNKFNFRKIVCYCAGNERVLGVMVGFC